VGADYQELKAVGRARPQGGKDDFAEMGTHCLLISIVACSASMPMGLCSALPVRPATLQERDLYSQLVASRKIEPGSSVQCVGFGRRVSKRPQVRPEAAKVG
jgi:hypothetical protein